MNRQQELEPNFVMRLRCPDRSHHYYAEVYHLGRLKNKETWYVWVPLTKNKECGMKEFHEAYEAFVKDVKEKTKEQIRKRMGTCEAEGPPLARASGTMGTPEVEPERGNPLCGRAPTSNCERHLEVLVDAPVFIIF